MDKVTQIIKKYLLRPLFWLLICLLFVFCSIIVAIRMPFVQNLLVDKAAAYLSSLTKHEVKVGFISIAWLDELLLENVVIYDRQKNEMIKVGGLRADFDLIFLVSSVEPAIREVWLDSPQVSTINLKDSDKLNINELIDAIAGLSTGKDTTVKKPFIFHVDKVHIENGSYTYSDETEDSLRDVFDYYHFTLHKINAEVDQLRIASDTFEINVRGLNCEDVNTKLKVKELNTFYRVCAKSMQFHNLYAEIGNSLVKDYLEFSYTAIKDLKNFNTVIQLKAHLDSSIVDTDDLKWFAPTLKELKETYTMSADVSGRVVDIFLKNLDLRYGSSSRMKGRITFTGFPKLEETFVNAKFSQFTGNYQDLEKYVGNNGKRILEKLGRISYQGTFTGFFSDFVARGNFNSDLGDVFSDINIKIREDERHSNYEGTLRTTNFQLGKLMDRSSLVGTLDMEGRIKGTGFSYAHAKLEVNASIKRIGVHDYQYKNLKVAANLTKDAFQGTLLSADSNAKFALNGAIDFTQSPHYFDFDANVAFINLQNLKILDYPLSFSTRADMNIYGNTIDEMQGDASFAHTYFTNGKKNLAFDTLKLITEKVQNQRFLNLFSDLFEVNVDGDFAYTSIMADLPLLINEYWLSIENKKEHLAHHYKTREQYSTGDYYLNYSVLLKKSNPILDLFTPDFRLSDNTKFNGTFAKTDRQTSFNVIGSFAKMQIQQVSMSDCRLTYASTKNLDHPFVSASGMFSSQRQRYSNSFKTDGIRMEMIWDNDKVKIDANLDQNSNNNHLHSKFDLTLNEGKIDALAEKLDIKLLETNWSGDSSHVVWSKDKLEVDRLRLKSDSQAITAQGAISALSKDSLWVYVQHFSLKPFGGIFEKNMEGTLDGSFILADLLTENYKIDFDGDVHRLKINNFLIGDIAGRMDWEPESKQFNVGVSLKRDTMQTLFLNGYVRPYDNNRLSLEADLDKFNLQVFEPFIGSYFSNLWGIGSGNLVISGTILRPNVLGKIHVDDGRFRFNFLKTTYTFTHDVTFDTSAISFRELTLLDTNQNKCVVNGQISHHTFKDFNLNIKAKFQNLLVLNTTEKDNSVFYGKVFGSGRMNLRGPLDDIKVTIQGKNEADSKIYIPLNMSDNLGGSEFIKFVQQRKIKTITTDDDTLLVVKEAEKISETSIEMDLDIDPEMEFELILDKQTGDIIKGTGSGQLKLQANTHGDFDVYGTYTFLNGRYNFSLLNLVSKKFDILQGSTISWNGDPMLGVLDIKAAIEERVSLKDIMAESDTAWFNHPAIRKRYPAYVNLSLKGNLLHPDIGYKIQIKEYPLTVNDSKLGTLQLDNYVRAFLQQLDANEQMLSRQVFSLLVFRKFFPANNSQGLASQGAAGTVSSLLSSQLSSWASQMDENLTIDIDLNGFNSAALDNLRVRLTYVPDILDKRIKITRDGNFGNSQTKSSVSSIAGDWSLEYMITRDGMLRLKMFTRNNYSSTTAGLQNANQTSTGFSFLHTKSFDNLKELIQRKKAQEKLEETVPSPDSVPVHPSDTAQHTKPKAVLEDRKKKESR